MLTLISLLISMAYAAPPQSALDVRVQALATTPRHTLSLYEVLKKAFPDLIDETTTVREIASTEFYARVADQVLSKELSESVYFQLREGLASVGVPASMPREDLQKFASNPDDQVFTRLRQISFSGYLHGSGTIAHKLEGNLIFFVYDFLKYYEFQYASYPVAPFAHMLRVSHDTMERVNAAIRDYLSGQDSRIDLDALKLSIETRAELNGLEFSGVVLDTDLRRSTLDTQALTEIVLSDRIRKGKLKDDERKACEALLKVWNSGKL